MLELAVFCVAAIAGILHVLWALKIWWPIQSEEELAKTVVGVKGIKRMPYAPLTWFVALLIFFGCALIAMVAGWIPMLIPETLVRTGAWIMSAVLTIRAISTYLFDKYMPPEEPFRCLNWRLYSPLILFLGLGTCWLLIKSGT